MALTPSPERYWSERVLRQVAAHGDPLDLGERVEIGLRAAVPGAGAGLPDTPERDQRLVVDGLVVDVHEPGGDALGQREALHHVPGEDAQRQAVLGAVGQRD